MTISGVPSSTQTAPHHCTIIDVATRAGVSRQTVSNAINAPHKLLPATLSRVAQSIEDLQYRPNFSAQSLRGKLTHQLAVLVCPDVARWRVDFFLRTAAFSAGRRGWDVLSRWPANDDEVLRELRDLSGRRAVDGFLIVCLTPSRTLRDALTHAPRPAVCAGTRLGPIPSVAVNDRIALRTLLSRYAADGYHLVTWLTTAEKGVSDRRRESLLARASAQCHLGPLSTLVVAGSSHRSARLAVAHLRRELAQPTVIVAANARLALGAIASAPRASSGPAVAVATFDDEVALVDSEDEITVIQTPVEDIAVHAVSALIALCQDPAFPVTHVSVEPRVIGLESAG